MHLAFVQGFTDSMWSMPPQVLHLLPIVHAFFNVTVPESASRGLRPCLQGQPEALAR